MKTHIAVKSLIERDGKYLVLKATYGKNKVPYYDLPGGRIKENESYKIALKREIVEETGLSSVRIGELLGTWSFQRLDGDRVLCHTYLCSTVFQEVNTLFNPDSVEDITGFLWLSKEELLSSALFQDNSIFDVFKKL